MLDYPIQKQQDFLWRVLLLRSDKLVTTIETTIISDRC
jgi:hypothetical protein